MTNGSIPGSRLPGHDRAVETIRRPVGVEEGFNPVDRTGGAIRQLVPRVASGRVAVEDGASAVRDRTEADLRAASDRRNRHAQHACCVRRISRRVSVKGRPSSTVQKLPGTSAVRLAVPTTPSSALVAMFVAVALLDCAMRRKRDGGIWPSAAVPSGDEPHPIKTGQVHKERALECMGLASGRVTSSRQLQRSFWLNAGPDFPCGAIAGPQATTSAPCIRRRRMNFRSWPRRGT